MEWIIAHLFQLICFSIGVFCWSLMDHFRDRVPEDSGFFSHKTGIDKFDIWHILKRIALFAFFLGMVRATDLYYLMNNVWIWAIVLAGSIQYIFYNGILKLLSRKSN